MRIAPQTLPEDQQAYIERRKPEWDDWPSREISICQELMNEYFQKENLSDEDLQMLEKYKFERQVLKGIFREKWNRDFDKNNE